MELSVQQLRALLALAQSETFCEAAKRAKMPQSTLRVSIQGLERYLGFSLVERCGKMDHRAQRVVESQRQSSRRKMRDGQTLVLTAMAKRLIPSVRTLEMQWEIAHKQLRADSRTIFARSLHLAGPSYWIEGRLQRSLTNIKRHWPELAIKISHCCPQTAFALMLNQEVDFALGISPLTIDESKVAVCPLEPSRLVVVVDRAMGEAIKSRAAVFVDDVSGVSISWEALFAALNHFRTKAIIDPFAPKQTLTLITQDDFPLIEAAKQRVKRLCESDVCFQIADSAAVALAFLRKAGGKHANVREKARNLGSGQSPSCPFREDLNRSDDEAPASQNNAERYSYSVIALMSEQSAKLLSSDDLAVISLTSPSISLPRKLYFNPTTNDQKRLWFIDDLLGQFVES